MLLLLEYYITEYTYSHLHLRGPLGYFSVDMNFLC